MPPPVDAADRKRRGVYYTPPTLVAFLVEQVVVPALSGRRTPPTVIDPACGDGRLLEAAGRAIAERFGVDPRPYLYGVEIDPVIAVDTAARLGVRVDVADGRHVHPDGPFDVVIGNPPYLSQLAAATARGGRSPLGGGPYADVAAEFLVASVALARPRGGRIGLVLPLSVLATRDVAPIRQKVADAAAIDLWWWAERPVFDAQVRTGVVGLVTGAAPRPVRRFFGPRFEPLPAGPAPHDGDTWSALVADVVGVPTVEPAASAGYLGDLCAVTADFRDEYYGLARAHAVSDAGDGPPLVTCGLIDPGRCHWGARPTRFAKARFAAPRVQLDALDPSIRAWAAARLVPKVLVASQTRVLEAVVDEAGAWLPSVPVVTVVPRRPGDLWRAAAVLTSPVASAWLAGRRLGSGWSARTVRVSAADLARVPLPVDRRAWGRAVTALRRGDVTGCGRHMLVAHGLGDRDDVLGWWAGLLPG